MFSPKDMIGSAKKTLKPNPFTAVRDPQTGVWLVCRSSHDQDFQHSPESASSIDHCLVDRSVDLPNLETQLSINFDHPA